MEARTQVRRIGTNINQATAAINTTGDPPVWLEHALTITNRAVTRLDEAAVAMTRTAADTKAMDQSGRTKSGLSATSGHGSEVTNR